MYIGTFFFVWTLKLNIYIRSELGHSWSENYVWLVLWCLTIFQLYRGGKLFLVEETRVRRENHQPVATHWQTWSHNVVSSKPRHERGSKLTTLVAILIGTDCTGSCNSNNNTITTAFCELALYLNITAVYHAYVTLISSVQHCT